MGREEKSTSPGKEIKNRIGKWNRDPGQYSGDTGELRDEVLSSTRVTGEARNAGQYLGNTREPRNWVVLG